MAENLAQIKMLWEGAYYSILASVIGAAPGYVCCIFVGAAQTDTLQLAAVPVAAIPLCAISRMRIADSIETVE